MAGKIAIVWGRHRQTMHYFHAWTPDWESPCGKSAIPARDFVRADGRPTAQVCETCADAADKLLHTGTHYEAGIVDKDFDIDRLPF